MEMIRTRSPSKHVKLILSSFSKTPLRSFQTLTPSSSSSSSSITRIVSLFSSFLRPPPPPHRRLFLLRPLSSSSSTPGQELDSKQQQSVSCSEEDSYQDHLIEVQQEKQSRFVPVKAYFLCTSIDLRGLQAQNAFNVIPPNSRAANYLVLRYYDVKGDPQAS